jgi:hypothetical protein
MFFLTVLPAMESSVADPGSEIPVVFAPWIRTAMILFRISDSGPGTFLVMVPIFLFGIRDEGSVILHPQHCRDQTLTLHN